MSLSATATAQTSDEDAIKAELAATIRQFGQALNAGDPDLLASLFLQSEKTNAFSYSEPLRIKVEGSFNGLLSLPPRGCLPRTETRAHRLTRR